MVIKGINIKWPVIIPVLILLGVGIYFLAPTVLPKMGFDTKTRSVAINPWAAYGAELRLNNGMVCDKTSRNVKEFGLRADFKRFDDRAPAVAALIAKEVDAAWVTVDVMSTETFEGSDLANLGISLVAFTDISRGADVVVVSREIKTIQDFRGKKVAYTDASASLTLLINLLESAHMTLGDIVPVRVASGVKASEMFQSRDVPIAVVWAPDDGDCVKKIQGAYRFFSTAKARNIVYDALIVRKADLQDKQFRLWTTKLVTSWLTANAECNQSESAKHEAAVIFDKCFTGYGVEVAMAGLNGARLTTYEDNRNLFGLNVSFANTGVTGEKLYNRMAEIYSQVPDTKGGFLTKNPLGWKEVADESIIKEITTLTGPEQAAEPEVVKFDPITTPAQEKQVATATPVASVKVIINFALGSAELDDFAKTILDRDVLPYAQGFSGYRIRVEGNTDLSGNTTAKGQKFNENLSMLRAKSVIEYLTKGGKFDPNRFTKPIGNGSNNPIYANETTDAEKSANRRTEVSFINE